MKNETSSYFQRHQVFGIGGEDGTTMRFTHLDEGGILMTEDEARDVGKRQGAFFEGLFPGSGEDYAKGFVEAYFDRVVHV